MLWALAVVTAFLTATYMFRLLYSRSSASGARAAATARTGSRGPRRARRAWRMATHGARSRHLHDAPPAMAIALVVLAIGSVLAGFVGVPHALGGHNQIEGFLEPMLPRRRAG